MSEDLIKNGDFNTGDFQHWIVQAFGTLAAVVHHNRSYQAKMEPGKETGQLLYTSFGAKPGPFTVTLEAHAPEAKHVEDPPHPDTHPLIVFFISGFSQDGTLIQTDVGAWWLRRDQQRFQYTGNMHADAVKAEVRISVPSDPLRVKGAIFLDNVVYTANAPKQGKSSRWSQGSKSR
jgi:hypothetical protein